MGDAVRVALRVALRVAAFVCAFLMILLAFQALNAEASLPGNEYNHARGGTATASGSTSPYVPANAIDNNTATYWQSSTTTGWLAVAFPARAYINEIHVHFHSSLTKAPPGLSLYADTSGNGAYETSEKVWSTTSWPSSNRDVVRTTATLLASGVKIQVDKAAGKNIYPKIAELQAFLWSDTDGDGLTNDQEANTVYYQDMQPGGFPQAIPDDGVNSTSAATALAQFYGTSVRALANFTADHPSRTDLTASIGYWNGSSWIDRYVWDPGKHLLEIGITQPDAVNYYAETVTAIATVAHPEITSKVEFRVNGTLQATVTAPVGNEYRWSWATSGDGPRALNVTQYDAVGARAWDQHTVKLNNLGPTTTWKTPASGATVSGTVTVKLSATDYYGVLRVNFYLDDVFQFGDRTPDTGTSDYTWTWDTTGTTNGAHTLKAIAYDNVVTPQQSTTTTIGVTTDNDPTVTITNPAAGSVVSGTVVVTASASSTSSTISKVEFYLGCCLTSTDTTAPYTWSWDTTVYPDGSHTISAKGYRASDNKVATASIQVTVANGGGGPGCGRICPTSPTFGTVETSAAESTPASQILGVLTAEWTLGEVDSGTRYTVVVDLAEPQTKASASENASRIFRPAFPLTSFTTYLQWRLVIRDWTKGGSGNVTAFTLRFEAKSDGANRDTDGDGIQDGEEVNRWKTLPTTRDSDLDGLTEDYEIAGHTLTLWNAGTSSILAALTTDPAKWDTDGDGLSDGQERGIVTTGQSKVIGEVGRVAGVTATCSSPGVKKVFFRNRYTTPVVIAQPASRNDIATGVVRVKAIDDHTFEVCFQEWAGDTLHAAETVDYVVIEAGNHVLPAGTVVEAGKVSAGTAFGTFAFREAFPLAPVLLAQTQSYADPDVVAARIRLATATGFDARIRVNTGDAHPAEIVGYVAIAPPSDPQVLATWTRGSVEVGASTNPATVAFPKNFTAAPRFLAWYATEGSTADLSLRVEGLTNASATLRREISGTPATEALNWFAFSNSMNLTARMTTRPSGTGSADTDADTLSDGSEVNTYGSNPTLKDTDADSIPDNVEVTDRTITIPVNGTMKSFTFKTSPTSDDTDADGVKDPDEIAGILDHRIAFYDMETTLTDGRLRDWSGNGGHGTLSGTTSVAGKVGNARSFASSNYLQVSDSPVLSPGMVTVAAWVSVSSSAGTYNPVVAKGQSGVDFQYYMDVRKVGTAWKLNVQVKSVAGTAASATSTGSITAGTWTHVAFTFDGSTVRLYINGAADATTASLSGSIRTTAQPLRIGHYFGSTTYFLGSIDEVQLWDRALSIDEIGQYSAVDLPVLRFDMESTRSDGKLMDFAGKGNAGTVFTASVIEGRIGFARAFAPAASSVNVTDTASLNFNTAGLTVSIYVLASLAPASDVSLVAKKGEFYLNLSSDGLVRFTIYTKTPLVSMLPLPMNRWVRVSATSDATTMALYFDDVLTATATGFKPTDTANPLTLSRAEGCTPSCPRFSGSLDELVVYAKGIAQTALTKSSARGILLNPNATDTDFDGLADGQELFVKSVKTPKRYPIPDYSGIPGIASTASMAAQLSAPASFLASATAMIGITHTFMGDLVVELHHVVSASDLSYVLRNRVGGSTDNNFTSYDMLNGPLNFGRRDFVAPDPWYLRVSDNAYADTGVIEYLQIQLTVRTLPNRADTDGDGLNDSEEMNLGSDGFSTDPWKVDTDADGWSDGYETLAKGTNPLAWDTDGDGARDSSDLDPLHNLLVAVRVNYVHHGADPWCSPELVGIMRVNDDYTWVSQHRIANLDPFTSWACPIGWPTTQYSTAYFGYTYYADVPDDVSSVSLRGTAWAINPGRGDDILVDAFVGYTLLSGTVSWTLSNGNSWYTFDVWTVALPKAKTLFVTDGNATLRLANGQSRLVGQDRYYVFTFDVTSAYGPFTVGVNAIVVPRSIFLDSKLRADFDAGVFAPLADAPLYGENLSQASVSESVMNVIALSLSGANAYSVLDRLLRNTTNVLVYSYIDVIPFGPTGAMPADFWTKIGAAASAVVNSLVQLGQMIYDGLVALGTFLVNLGEAIWDWGMKQLGQLWTNIVTVAQKAGEVLGQFVSAFLQFLEGVVRTVLDVLLRPVYDMLREWVGDVRAVIERILGIGDTDALDVEMLDGAVFPSRLLLFVEALATGIQVAIGLLTIAALFNPGSAAIAGIFKKVILAALKSAVEHWLASTLLAIAVGAIIGAVIPKDQPIWGWTSAVGTLVVALFISWIQVKIAKKYNVPTAPLDADRKGLIVNFVGFFLADALLAANATGIWAVIGAWAAAVLAGYGALVIFTGQSWNDELDKYVPGLGFVDELVGAATFGFTLGVASTTR